jgi:zinc D-Ala-D-Ala carboxypeptidase
MEKNNRKVWYWIGGIAGGLFLLSLINRERVMSDLRKVKLTANFSLDEFVVTSTGIENIPGPEEVANLRLLAEKILQPLRTYLNQPIVINSAYRSPLVNKAIGGSKTSQHMTGQAADIHVPGLTNQQIIDAIRALKLPFDQLIDEQLKGKKWVHVSYDKNGGRRQLMTARDGANGSTVYATISRG